MNGRLTVTTHAGVCHKLLWLGTDPAFLALVATLPEKIPGRMELG